MARPSRALCAVALLSLALVAAACTPGLRYDTITLAPEARQQLFLREYGSRRAVGPCPVDDTGLRVVFDDLAADAAQVGYESTDLPKDSRPRCRRDRNLEHHAWLSFDVTPVAAGGTEGTLRSATLSGVAVLDPSNQNCGLTRRSPFGGFLAGINTDTQLDFTVPDTPEHDAREVEPILLDGRPVPFRERQLALGAGDTGPRTGSAPNFVFAFSPEVVAAWREALARGADRLDLTLIGRANPDMTGDRRCLERLTDLRLLLVFAAPR